MPVGEVLINSSTKAIAELSETLFVPAMIIGLVIEFPFYIIEKTGFQLLEAYLAYAIAGFILSFLLIWVLGFFKSENMLQYFITGSFIMPVGIAAIVPEYFESTSISIPLEKGTGACICIWSFFLMRHFFGHAKKR